MEKTDTNASLKIIEKIRSEVSNLSSGEEVSLNSDVEEKKAMLSLGKWLKKIDQEKENLSPKELSEMKLIWSKILATISPKAKKIHFHYANGMNFVFQSETQLFPNKVELLQEDFMHMPRIKVGNANNVKVYSFCDSIEAPNKVFPIHIDLEEESDFNPEKNTRYQIKYGRKQCKAKIESEQTIMEILIEYPTYLSNKNANIYLSKEFQNMIRNIMPDDIIRFGTLFQGLIKGDIKEYPNIIIRVSKKRFIYVESFEFGKSYVSNCSELVYESPEKIRKRERYSLIDKKLREAEE